MADNKNNTTDTTDKDDFLATARRRAKDAQEAWGINFEDMDDDIKMLHGKEQWEETVKQDRKNAGRPALTFNRLAPIHDQIVGDLRKMTPTLKVIPVQGDAGGINQKFQNVAGTKDYSQAQVLQGILMNIEYCSDAESAYDTAGEHCSGWGLGYLCVEADYMDERSFDQDLTIHRVRNYKSCLIDPNFDRADGSDISYGFRFFKLHKDDFKEQYPGKECADWDQYPDDTFELWADGEYVFVAKYYYLKPHKFTIHQLSDGRVVDDDQYKLVAKELAKQGIKSIRKRTSDGHKCCYAKISGTDILEEERDTVFRRVPIAPVLGKELVVEGDPRYRGAIRHAKDAQRMYNYSRTADIERTALIPKAPYVLADRQVAGYEEEWKNANKSTQAYLVYKHVTGIPAPHREPPVSTNPGDFQQSLQAADDVKATTGYYDASLGNRSNEQSGIAIERRKEEGDTGSYPFTDNLMRAMRNVGRLLVDAIPKIYDTQRIVRLKFPDDSEDFVEINQSVMIEGQEEPVIIHDMSMGKFDIQLKAGPGFSTQRREAAEMIVSFITSIGANDPIAAKALTAMAAKNMDWPGSQEIYEMLVKLLPDGLIEGTDETDKEQEPKPPTPQELLEQAQMDLQMAKNDAEKAKAEATLAKAQADIEKAKASEMDSQVTLAEVLERVHQMESNQRQQIAEAIAEAMIQMQQVGQA